MILSSTMRKLQARNAVVYVVTCPAHVVPAGQMGALVDTTIPEWRDVFADRSAAYKAHADRLRVSRLCGLPEPTLQDVPAVMLDAWTLEPVKA